MPGRDHAVDDYGEGARARCTAFAALKRAFESGERFGGAGDQRITKEELDRRAKKLGVGEIARTQ